MEHKWFEREREREREREKTRTNGGHDKEVEVLLGGVKGVTYISVWCYLKAKATELS